jgi:hypothetical protein
MKSNPSTGSQQPIKTSIFEIFAAKFGRPERWIEMARLLAAYLLKATGTVDTTG